MVVPFPLSIGSIEDGSGYTVTMTTYNGSTLTYGVLPLYSISNSQMCFVFDISHFYVHEHKREDEKYFLHMIGSEVSYSSS
jgi:hypothetical protein